MAEGQVYVEVDASTVNGGIAPMAMVSGNPEPVDGQSYVVVWIRWNYDDATGEGGYTGTGWYYSDADNNISKHFASEADFKKWLVDNHVSNLDSILSDWDAKKKSDFLNKYLGTLEDGGCVYFTANPNL